MSDPPRIPGPRVHSIAPDEHEPARFRALREPTVLRIMEYPCTLVCADGQSVDRTFAVRAVPDASGVHAKLFVRSGLPTLGSIEIKVDVLLTLLETTAERGFETVQFGIPPSSINLGPKELLVQAWHVHILPQDLLNALEDCGALDLHTNQWIGGR